MLQNISITTVSQGKEKPKTEDLVFGTNFTDHMFLMNYDHGQGWHSPRIVPYGPIPIDPAAKCLHYAQEVFEGMKAYRSPQGEIQLFRPMDNINRFNDSGKRVCIPEIPADLALDCVKALVEQEKDWIPKEKDASLYIRPFTFACDAALGVHASHHYLFAIILCPVGAYYPEGLNPVKIFVESRDVRAVKGGTGMAKTGGNYAASLRAGERAEEKGFTQVLWLDGVHRKYVEEVGAMNVMFLVDGKILTPDLNGSVLDGITRRSCLTMLRDWGYEVEERRIDIQELFTAMKEGRLTEAWGCGTAAVISPIGAFALEEETCQINEGKIGELTQKLYDNLTGIQWGRLPDPYGWVMKL
ncbi:MAG: branched-chain amino acid aminotransferase [Eubacteriales bacterium]